MCSFSTLRDRFTFILNNACCSTVQNFHFLIAMWKFSDCQSKQQRYQRYSGIGTSSTFKEIVISKGPAVKGLHIKGEVSAYAWVYRNGSFQKLLIEGCMIFLFSIFIIDSCLRCPYSVCGVVCVNHVGAVVYFEWDALVLWIKGWRLL